MILLNGENKKELEDKQGTQHHTESLFLQLDIKKSEKKKKYIYRG